MSDNRTESEQIELDEIVEWAYNNLSMPESFRVVSTEKMKLKKKIEQYAIQKLEKAKANDCNKDSASGVSVNALVRPTPKDGSELYIWTIKGVDNDGKRRYLSRYIITPITDNADEFVEELLNKNEFIDICHTLTGTLDADVEVWV